MKSMSAILIILTLGISVLAQEKAVNRDNTTKLAGQPTLSGSGTPGHVSLWVASDTLGDSAIVQSGQSIGIGTNSPKGALDVKGTINALGFTIGHNLFSYGFYSTKNAFSGFAGNRGVVGVGNTADGYLALASDIGDSTGDGAHNTAIGAMALYSANDTSRSNSKAQDNTAIGYVALYSNTTADQNTATGKETMYHTTTGSANTASGDAAMFNNTTGAINAAFGAYSMGANTIGSENTAIGTSTLVYNTTGNFNTALGYGAGTDQNSPNLTNATAIGATATVSESNAIVLGGTGDFAVNVGIGTPTPANVFTIAQGAGPAIADSWKTYSSRRWKTNVQTLQGALDKVEQLRGVSYDLKGSGSHEIGVIAEEVGSVVPEVVSYEKNSKEAQGVDYGRLTALLIEAVKEQQEQIRTQQAEIARLRSEVKAVEASVKANGDSGLELHTVKAQMLHQ